MYHIYILEKNIRPWNFKKSTKNLVEVAGIGPVALNVQMEM